MKRFFPLLCGGLLLALLLTGPVGCQRREGIRTYDQPKLETKTEPKAEPEPELEPEPGRFEHPMPTRPAEQRQLLGALVPHEGKLWLFKIVGPPQRVGPWNTHFFQFIGKLTFDEKGEPVWQLPADWQQQPGEGMRFATIRLGTDDPPLEMAVMEIIMQGEPRDAILQTTNIWFNQIGLPPLDEEGFKNKTSTIEIAGGKATFVNFLSVPPAEENTEPALPQAMPPSLSPPPKWTYTTPEGWTPLPAEGMNLAAFQLEQDGRQGKVTVITMGPGGADMLENVNRWREQLELYPIDQVTLDTMVQPVEVSGRPMQMITIVGPPDGGVYPAIVGVVGLIDDRAWAFTLKADYQLAEQEKARFLQFLASVKIEPAAPGGSE